MTGVPIRGPIQAKERQKAEEKNNRKQVKVVSFSHFAEVETKDSSKKGREDEVERRGT